MTPHLTTAPARTIIGLYRTMSLANYTVASLWQNLMPRRREITNNRSGDLISLSVYPTDYFTDFKPTNEFTRWTGIEVADFSQVPRGMSTLVVPGGLYAVFDYVGLNTDHSVYQYIYQDWLPQSGYLLDDRPHYEILGEGYKNNGPSSRETIWIPITSRNTNG